MAIDKLKATINKHDGMAVQNRYNIMFTPPSQSLLNLNFESILSSALSGGFSMKNLINDPRDISLLSEKVNLPGRKISTFQYGAYEQENSYPYDFIDDDCQMTFRGTNDFYIRRMFDNWLEGIYSSKGHVVGYKDDYAVDVVIQVLNVKNIPVYGVRLEKAYPVSISGIDLNQDAQAPVSFTVDWKYDKFVPEGALSSSISIARTALEILT